MSMNIENTQDLRVALRQGAYASAGGYPLFFITNDGEGMHPKCVLENYRLVSAAVKNRAQDGWRVVAMDANWEDASLICVCCDERIESAYAEDEVAS